MKKTKISKRILIYGIIFAVAFTYLVWLSNGGGFDCVFLTLTGLPCVSCGATRAALDLLTLDISGGIAAQPFFALFFYPAAILLIIEDFAVCIIRRKSKRERKSIIEFLVKD